MNPRQEYKKLINSFKYAIEGIISSFKTERNMKIHVLAMIIVIALGLFFKLNKLENSESAELNNAITINAITIVKKTAFIILCFSPLVSSLLSFDLTKCIIFFITSPI